MIIDNYKNRFQFNNLRNFFFDNKHNFNYFISNVIISLANFLIIFFFIKFLSPELYADIIKLKISVFVLNIISTLGISQSYIFYKDTEYLNIERYNFYLLVLCLFSILLTVIVILFLRYSYEVKLNIYASTSLIFLNIFIILNNDLLNRLRADFYSHKYKILVLVRHLLLIFLLSLNISNNFQIENYIYCYLSSEIFLSLFCGKEILKIKVDLIFFKKFLVQGIPFCLIALFSYLYQFLDRFIIELYMGKLILAKYDVIFFFS